METLVYHLRREELNAAFLDGVRSDIDAERITVVISADNAAFEEKIYASVQDPISFVFEGDEFERYSEQLLRGEQPSVESYKRVRT
ncbi:MAG: hypothetical protein ACOVSW_14620 [Candidatus Kapaibacteriota bacterium]|jgi:hypothetical protein